MNIPMWNIRLLDKPFNAKVAYDGHPTLFTIKLYHGGEFTKFPDVQYIDGSVNYVDMVDIDTFSVHELDAIMKGFRYGVPPVIYYHFLVPGGDFHFGLKPLGNDDDLRTFAQYVCDHKIMRVYTEHGETKLLTYFMNPKPVKKVTIVQMDEIDENDDNENHTAEVQEFPSPPRSSPVEVEVQPLHVEVHDRQKELIANDFMEAATEFDIGLYQKMLQSNADVHEHVQVEVEEHVQDEVEEHAQVEVEKNVQDEVELDHGHEAAMEDNLDNYMDNYIDNNMDDYMETEMEHDNGSKSDGEDGSISDRGEGSHCDEENDSEDSDWVDEENIIPEVEVDMRDFHMSIDTEAEFFEKRLRNSMEKDRNQEHEDMELDVIDNDEWDSTDDDSEMGKKRRQVIKELEYLGDDLDLSQLSNFTFISDRQKGLIPAIAQLFPVAEHRFCLRHIYENMRKRWRTTERSHHNIGLEAISQVDQSQTCF
ncbi:unnamed protein product [Lactuca saligna]|uniref:PB1-like domain-containing protein n=1 Tax=Lactuca saligna TaxID=75948 RepID=A0AA35YQZ2_LACSI|nr:unnamed protein product [Lactuca saligna]